MGFPGGICYKTRGTRIGLWSVREEFVRHANGSFVGSSDEDEGSFKSMKSGTFNYFRASKNQGVVFFKHVSIVLATNEKLQRFF